MKALAADCVAQEQPYPSQILTLSGASKHIKPKVSRRTRDSEICLTCFLSRTTSSVWALINP